jgi:hypothetical protein
MMTVHANDRDHGPLSDPERAALRALHRGWRFGVDAESEQSLERRGLLTVGNWQVGVLVFHEMPFLTDHGARIAARLVEEQDAVVGRRQLPPGFSVIQGGLA